MHHLGDILNHKEIMEQEERGAWKGRKEARVRQQSIFRYINSFSVMTEYCYKDGRHSSLEPGTRTWEKGMDLGRGARVMGRARYTCHPGVQCLLPGPAHQPCVLSEDHLRSWWGPELGQLERRGAKI